MIITQDSIDRINKMVAHAEANPFSFDDLLDRVNHPELSPGLDEKFQLFIPQAFKIVFTIEHQPPGKARHLSMSVSEKNQLPPIQSVKTIMDLVGFKNKLEACHVFEEKLEPGYTAINVLELI